MRNKHIEALTEFTIGGAIKNIFASNPFGGCSFVGKAVFETTDEMANSKVRMARYGRKEQELMRTVRLFSICMVAYLAQVVGVHASMTCKRIEQLPTVSDSRTLGLLEAYGKVSGGSKPLLIRQFDSRFFMAFPADQDCKNSACYYRLLDLKDGEIKERFSFQGTGVILIFFSSSVQIDQFQDRFFTIALETSAQTHIAVQLPFTGDTVLVSAWAPQQIKLPTC